jgi:thioesterase domain-containing protein
MADNSILANTVYVDGANRPFGELTVAQVRAHADELKAATGWGPTARVAPVARAWRELVMALEQAQVATVGELDAEQLGTLAPKLWVVPPGGSLLP